MFDKSIVDSERFYSLPLEAQLLYFHLGMHADVKGFVEPRKIARLTGIKVEAIASLIGSHLVIPFNSGVVVITDWNLNNKVREDREALTRFKEELSMISLSANNSYQLQDNSRSTPAQYSIEEVSIEEVSIVTEQLPTPKKRTKEKTLKEATPKISTVALFELNQKEVADRAKEMYPNKNIDTAIKDFIGYINTRNTKYKDFKLAFFEWVRKDRFNQYNNSNIRANGSVIAPEGKYNNILINEIQNGI